MPTNLPEIFSKPLAQLPNLWSNFFDDRLLPSWAPTLPNLADRFALTGARVYEENNHLNVEVPLPGLNAKDIDISLNKGVLLIKGESKEEEKQENKNRKIYQFSKRSYAFSVPLPTQIDEKQEPQAFYEDGILNISLQLSKQAETKKIAVKAGNGGKKNKD